MICFVIVGFQSERVPTGGKKGVVVVVGTRFESGGNSISIRLRFDGGGETRRRTAPANEKERRRLTSINAAH